MIIEIKGKKYLLQNDTEETQVLDFEKFSEDEILLVLLDRIEFLIETNPIGFENEMFRDLGNILDNFYRRKRKEKLLN